MLIQRISRLTGQVHIRDLPVTVEGMARYNAGEKVQIVFPDLTPAQREFILSGITPEEWEEAYGGE